MLERLLSRFAKPSPSAVRAPDGRRLYAIGDIHGHLDLLEGLLARIRADEAAHGGPKGELIFLGDLINRGPQSAQVIDHLIAVQAERPETRFLLGNHEEVFLKALGGDGRALRFFDRMGGTQTILSYGIAREAYDAADYDELAEMLQVAVPPAHRAFLASFEDLIVEGNYVFVHAGIRPGVPLDEQQPGDLRWIRDEFLRLSKPLIPGMVIIHGHTICDDIVERPGRIGLDTGAYRSGVLSAMGFEDSRRWILQENS